MKVCPQHGPQGMPLGPNCPACGAPLLDSLEMLGLGPIEILDEPIVPLGPHPRLPALPPRPTYRSDA